MATTRKASVKRASKTAVKAGKKGAAVKKSKKVVKKKTAKKAARKVVKKVTKKTAKKVAKKKVVKKAVKKKTPKKGVKKAATKVAKKTTAKKSVKKAAKKAVKKAAKKKAVKKTTKKAVKRAAKKVTRKKAVRKPAKSTTRKVVKRAAPKKRVVKKAAAPRAPRKPVVRASEETAPWTEPRVVPPPVEAPISIPAPDAGAGLAVPELDEGRGPTFYEPDELPPFAADEDDVFGESRLLEADAYEGDAGDSPTISLSSGGAPAEDEEDEPDELAVGQRAPDFALPDAHGDMHTLASYRGRKVVLYFYPKDDTPGCTREACGFRDTQVDFEERNAVVLGVSPDSPGSHTSFAQKYSLRFPLLADESAAVAERYGVWRDKPKIGGGTKLGVHRTTFVIDESGIIVRIFEQVRPEGHEDEVLAWLDEARHLDV